MNVTDEQKKLLNDIYSKKISLNVEFYKKNSDLQFLIRNNLASVHYFYRDEGRLVIDEYNLTLSGASILIKTDQSCEDKQSMGNKKLKKDKAEQKNMSIKENQRVHEDGQSPERHHKYVISKENYPFPVAYSFTCAIIFYCLGVVTPMIQDNFSDFVYLVIKWFLNK